MRRLSWVRFFVFTCAAMSILSPDSRAFTPPVIPASPHWSNPPSTPPADAPRSNTPAPPIANKPGLDIRIRGSFDFLAFGPPGCPIVIADNRVWNLPRGDSRSVAFQFPRTSQPITALSASGKLLAVSGQPFAAPNAADVTFLNTDTGEKVSSILSSERGADISEMQFAGEKQLVIVTGNFVKRSPVLEIWNVASGKLDHKITAKFSPDCVSVSPDGTTVAVANEESLDIYKLATGDLLATMRAPDLGGEATAITITPDTTQPQIRHYRTPFNGLRAVAFAPSGQQLAALRDVGGRHRLLVWNLDGTIANDFSFQAPYSRSIMRKTSPLSWLPGEEGWIVENASIVDRSSGRPLFFFRNELGTPQLLLIDDHRFLALNELDQPATIVDVPLHALHSSLLDALNPHSTALLHAGSSVSLEVEDLDPRGKTDPAITALQKAITDRLKQDGISIAPGQPVTAHVSLREGRGKSEHVIVHTDPFDSHGTDTGQIVTPSHGVIHVQFLETATKKELFGTYLTAESRRPNTPKSDDDLLRSAMLDDAGDEVAAMELPYYIAHGPAGIVLLPSGITSIPAPDKQFLSPPSETPSASGK